MDREAAASPSQAPSKPPRPVEARLLTESIRAWEEHHPDAPLNDADAVAAAINTTPDDDFARRLLARAALLPGSESWRHDLHRAHALVRWVLWGLASLAFLAGVLAVRGALTDRTVSVFALIFGLLGVQTAMLLTWMLVLIFGGRVAAGGVLGGLGAAVVHAIVRQGGRADRMAAIAEAMAVVHLSPRSIRPTLSALNHAMWTSVNLGMLTMLAALFIGEGYAFRWDSTWLNESSYQRLIEWIAIGPRGLGFETPTSAQITSSRLMESAAPLPAQDALARSAWAWFAFGSIVTYGFLPRAALWTACWVVRRRVLRADVIDTARPGFVKHRTRLVPVSHSQAFSGNSDSHRQTPTAPPGLEIASARPPGRPGWIGVELRSPASGWPPPSGAHAEDLGLVDGREEQHGVIEHLRSATTSPNPLIIVVELASSPDRGMERFIGALSASAGGRCILVLTGGRAMARHADEATIAHRAADWRALAARLGMPGENAIEADLDHFTGTTRTRLEAMMGGGAGAPASPSRHLETAFAIIAEHAMLWGRHVSLAAQVKLHEAVTSCYGGAARERWWALLGGHATIAPSLGVDAKAWQEKARGVIEGITAVLPAAWRIRPAWMGAGALTGVVACAAAAVALAPAAAASLPMWALVGAGVGALLSPRGLASAIDPESPAGHSTFSQAVRAAALDAILLESQGLPEAGISRILQRVSEAIGDSEEAPADGESLAPWLDALRHAFDDARQRESNA